MSGLNTAFGLIFGGCCSNVFTLEAIVKYQPNTGLLITVVQFALTALFALPSQLHRTPQHASASSKTKAPTSLSIASPKIPLPRLALLALLFFAVNMLNNWAFAFNISVPMHIILRSFGSVQTMAVGWVVGKRYSRVQVGSVMALTVGVVVSAWADAVGKGKLNTPTSSSTTKPPPNMTATTSSSTPTTTDSSSYLIGLALLFTAQLISAYMGILTESTYTAYGRHWSETLFYTHFFSFLFSLTLTPTLLTQYRQLMSPSHHHSKSSHHTTNSNSNSNPNTTHFPFSYLPSSLKCYTPALTHPTTLLTLNALTQIACISGVNRLSASTTAVTVTVVLNIRKLVSFLLSCVIFGNHVSGLMGVGAGLVFVGGAVYGWDSSRGGKKMGRVVGKVQDGEEEDGEGKEKVREGGGVGGGRAGGSALDDSNGEGKIRRRLV